MLRLSIVKNFNFLSKTLTPQVDPPIFGKNLVQSTNFNGIRQISLTTARLCDSNKEKESDNNDNEEGEGGEEGEKQKGYDISKHWRYKKWLGTPRDRTKIIPVETSIEYLKSSAFKSTYGEKKVWELYRRVHKGQMPRKYTRRDCISHGTIAFGSPCPICRDEYLVLDYRNLELLQMFISPHTGEVNTYSIILVLSFAQFSSNNRLNVIEFCRFFHLIKRAFVRDNTRNCWCTLNEHTIWDCWNIKCHSVNSITPIITTCTKSQCSSRKRTKLIESTNRLTL